MSNDGPVTDWGSDFNIFDPEYTNDPVPVWQHLQATCPIAHTDRWGGMWMTTTYDDAQALVKETSILSNRQVSIAPMREDSDLLADYHSEMNPPITKDPPEHTPLRRLILPFFNPKAVEAYRPFTEQLCHHLIDQFIDEGSCDAAADYAQQLTPRVIGHMLGIDTGRADEFVEWTRGLVELGYEDIELRSRSMKAMQAFFGEMVEARRRKPADDYISQLLDKDVDGVPLDDKMVVNLCVLLLIAGIDTTWSSLGSALLHFATHQEDRRRMVAEPDLFPTAIEELLRFYAPVSVGRIAMEDFDYKGVHFKRGDRVMLNFPAANRDPEKFERADEVVLDRQKNRHIAFGIGVHRCAGSNLARMEMDVALRTWFQRIPEFSLSDPEKVTWSPGQVRGARCVPVTF
jgi:cytochrome P450